VGLTQVILRRNCDSYILRSRKSNEALDHLIYLGSNPLFKSDNIAPPESAIFCPLSFSLLIPHYAKGKKGNFLALPSKFKILSKFLKIMKISICNFKFHHLYYVEFKSLELGKKKSQSAQTAIFLLCKKQKVKINQYK